MLGIAREDDLDRKKKEPQLPPSGAFKEEMQPKPRPERDGWLRNDRN